MKQKKVLFPSPQNESDVHVRVRLSCVGDGGLLTKGDAGYISKPLFDALNTQVIKEPAPAKKAKPKK